MAGNSPSNSLYKAAYNTAHFSTGYLNVPPNMHRLFNAVGLTVGLFLGRKVMDIVVGQTPDGTKIDAQDVPLVLRPLHGLLPYDHFSDDPAHRWMKVFDMTVPAVLGGIGAGVGSDHFSRKNFITPVKAQMAKMAAAKTPEQMAEVLKNFGLVDAEKQALYHQGKPWGLTSMVSAVFGSASGFGLFPSFINYSSTLGAKFTLFAERSLVAPWLGKSLRAKLINSHHPLPFRPTKAIHEMARILLNDPNDLKAFDEVAEGVVKTWFRNVPEDKVKAFATIIKRERDTFIGDAISLADKAHKMNEVESFVTKSLDSLIEKYLIEAKIDPREAAVGDSGFISTFGRWVGDALGFGTTKKLQKTQELLVESMNERHGDALIQKFGLNPKNLPDLRESSIVSKVMAGTLIGTGLATVGAIATAKDTTVKDLSPDSNSSSVPVSFTEKIAPRKHIVHSKKERGLINGWALDTAEGITGMFNAGIGMHRVHCAVGLTVGSWLGDEIMKALTGRTFAGSPVVKENLWRPLQELHGKLAFDPHSVAPKDKWMQVLRWAVPGVIGMAAVMQGSKLFFEERSMKLKKARYIDEVEDKVTMAQSQPWSYTSAISSLMGFPTGIPMLPLVNYSTNLGTRFSMAAGRKVAMPIVGKIWSNNSTLFPFGPSGMINLLIKEAVNNKSNDPELLETYAIGILKPWFDNITPQQVESFVQQVHAVRDHYLKQGGVPEEMKAQLETELKAHFKGAGLEETLEQIGLDPSKAHLGNNGLSGAIANALGAKRQVDKISVEYAKGYADRLHKRHKDSPSDPTLAV